MSLRNTVLEAELNQRKSDYGEFLKQLEEKRFNESILDLVNSNSVACLKPVAVTNSTVLTTPNIQYVDGQLNFSRKVVHDKSRLISNRKSGKSSGMKTCSKKKQADLANKAKEDNEKLVIAFDKLSSIRGEDPSLIYFEVAVIFEDLLMYDRAVKYYGLATKRAPADNYVDRLQLPDTKEHFRKLERYSKGQRAAYVQKRADLRERLIHTENEHRRIRALVAHGTLFRMSIFLNDYVGAHVHLCQLFNTCSRVLPDGTLDKTNYAQLTSSSARQTVVIVPPNKSKEHYVALRFSHSCLMEVTNETGRIEIVPSLQILRENGGTLAEAHIVILTELWMWIQDQASVEDSKEVDGGEILEWLGKRYAERCDFEASRDFFQQSMEWKRKQSLAASKRIAAVSSHSNGNMSGLELPVDANTGEGFDAFGPYKPPFDRDSLLPAIRKEMNSCGTSSHCQIPVPAVKSHDNVKKALKSYGQFADVDRKRIADRTDFTSFGGNRQGSDTILYTTPPQGWDFVDK